MAAQTYTRRTMVHVLDRASRVALDLLFPPRCALCRCGGAMLCVDCAAALPPANGLRCFRCWMPLADGVACHHCTAEPPSFVSLRAAFVMDEGARQLVHRLKYDGMTALAEPMGAFMAGRLEPTHADLVVPVPLHRGRMRGRGFNQSALLAKHLAAAACVPVDPRAAQRIRATKPLARTMHRDERRAIVAGAFAGVPGRVEGRRVLLVDDVVTTGATLDACSKALLAAGATSVLCVTFARAD